MRPFELLFLLLLVPVFWPRRQSSALVTQGLAAAVAVVGGLHWMIEGARWQLVPAYLVALLWLLSLAWGATWRRGHWAALALVAFSLVAALLFPVITLPPLPGEHGVGTRLYHLDERGRPEPYSSDPNAHRELMLQIWYPADVEPAVPFLPYLEDADQAGPAILRGLGLPPFLLNHGRLIATRSQVGLPVAPSDHPYPVLLFSHGLRGTRFQNSGQIEALVSTGYIVAAVDHAYAAGYTRFPDGRAIVHDPGVIAWGTPDETASIQRLGQVWADDLERVLIRLEQFNESADSPFHKQLNLDQLGVFGHSTGGGATVMFCAQQPRCRAALLLDPWLVPVADRVLDAGIAQPVLILRSPVPISERNDELLDHFFDNLPGRAWQGMVAGSAHFDFSDFAALSPLLRATGMTGPIGAEQGQEVLFRYSRAFFDYTVRGWDGALLFAESAEFPQVTITMR
jgi:predicted dienelactone hydrolase